MTPSQYIRQWCNGQGYAYKYGNPTHINVWMGETDFSASTDGVGVFAHLLTASDYDPSGHDRHNLAVYFATLTPFDFDTDTIDQVTEGLHARAKSLLAYIQQGNVFGWEGARFQYGYDDYAENVAWCCLRVTLTALAAECVEMPTPTIDVVSMPSVMATAFAALGVTATTHDNIVSGIDGANIFFGAAVVTPSDISDETASIMCNGTELAVEKNTDLIDANMIALYPELADYEGWYLTGILSNDAVIYQSGAYNVVISIGNVWTATATWEEA